MPSGSWGLIKEVGLPGHHLDAEPFLFAAHDVDCIEFAALVGD
jgi:hypothetical protein